MEQIPGDHSRSGYEISYTNPVAECRNKLARLFSSDHPERIVFTSGSTESINLAINGLELNNCHVITTEIEHNSVLRPLMHLKDRGRVELTIVDCDLTGNVLPEDIEAAVRPDTALVVVNHCSNVTGRVLDIAGICKVAHQHGIPVLVDASQSAGMIAIDAKKLEIDMLAFTGHKFLYSLPGIGGLYVRPGIDLKPLKVGGTGVRSDLLLHPEEMPTRLEAGTLNYPGIVSLLAGLEFIEQTGIDRIRRRITGLVSGLIKRLVMNPEIIFIGLSANTSNHSMLSFNIRSMDASEAGYILENSFAILVRSGLHCAPLIHKALGTHPCGAIRVSPSYFTTEDELDCLIDALEKICKGAAVYAHS